VDWSGASQSVPVAAWLGTPAHAPGTPPASPPALPDALLDVVLRMLDSLAPEWPDRRALVAVRARRQPVMPAGSPSLTAPSPGLLRLPRLAPGGPPRAGAAALDAGRQRGGLGVAGEAAGAGALTSLSVPGLPAWKWGGAPAAARAVPLTPVSPRLVDQGPVTEHVKCFVQRERVKNSLKRRCVTLSRPAGPLAHALTRRTPSRSPATSSSSALQTASTGASSCCAPPSKLGCVAVLKSGSRGAKQSTHWGAHSHPGIPISRRRCAAPTTSAPARAATPPAWLPSCAATFWGPSSTCVCCVAVIAPLRWPGC
jgi:hypothetical protein